MNKLNFMNKYKKNHIFEIIYFILVPNLLCFKNQKFFTRLRLISDSEIILTIKGRKYNSL